MRAPNLLPVVFVALSATQLAGCSTLAFWKDKPAATSDASDAAGLGEANGEDEGGGEAPAGVKPIKGSALDEHELKVARLWARVDELEEEQLRQKERVRVLEKAVTLGLVPEELKPRDEPAPIPEVKVPARVEPLAKLELAEPPPAEAKPAPASSMSSAEQERYQAALASAHDHYRAGRYGRAVVEYSDIGKNFGDKPDGGMHLYWVARCWINLKEYNTARQLLVDFLKNHPGSSWAPRGKLELARVEWHLGLGETALQRFRDIIQQHPYEDAAEMAKMELQNLDKSL